MKWQALFFWKTKTEKVEIPSAAVIISTLRIKDDPMSGFQFNDPEYLKCALVRHFNGPNKDIRHRAFTNME